MTTPFGPHVQNAGLITTEGWEWIRSAPIVKELDTTQALRQAHNDACTVYRRYIPPELLEVALTNHVWTCNYILEGLQGFRPTLVQVLCEQFQNSNERLNEHIALDRYACEFFAPYGIRIAALGLSVGNPHDMNDWFTIRDNLFSTLEYYGGALMLDEYWGMCDPTQSLWAARRHELVHSALNGQHPPFLLGECGRDFVFQDMPQAIQDAVQAGADPHQWAGWKTHGISADQYRQELLQYQQLLPSYVIGATPYGIACNPDWDAFAYDDLLPIAFQPAAVILPPIGGQPVAWDRHVEYDTWQNAFGGQGYNPSDAFGKIIAANPTLYYGAFVGPYRDHGDIITAWTTVGVFWYDKRTTNAGFATSEEELPLA